MSKYLKIFTLLLTVTLLGFAHSLPVSALGTSPTATDTDLSLLALDPNFSCTDLKILFARGSGADFNSDDYLAYKTSSKDVL